MLNHPIVEQSFAIIDSEISQHDLNPEEYAIARRVIHATADFEYLQLLQFSPDAIASGINAIASGVPIITDVTMVERGIRSLVAKTFKNPLISAIEFAETAAEGKTRTETGLCKCWEKYPQGIYVIGNAPTALLALCDLISRSRSTAEERSSDKPALVVGAPVGFVSTIESKQALSKIDVPQILTLGRKGGSPVAASIVNALIVLAHSR